MGSKPPLAVQANRPAMPYVLSFATEWRGLGKDVGEWAMYALLALIVLTLWQKLLPYKPWRKLHRVMPVLYTVALMPLSLWAVPMGVLMGALLAVGSGAALWSLLGKIGQARQYSARIDSVQLLGQHAGQDPLEVLWPCRPIGQDTTLGSLCLCSLMGPKATTPSPSPALLGPVARRPMAQSACAW